MKEKIASINWQIIAEEMHQKGFALIPNFFSGEQCSELIKDYTNSGLYRKTVVMERYRFGVGEYKYFNYPLPEHIQELRESIYPKLASIANRWMEVLNLNTKFPDTHQQLLNQCNSLNQTKATVLILKYGKGGYNTLHQDLYGDLYFPMQAVLFLNEPEKDFTGGEFVLIQQIPRAQSKAVVLQPKKGDMLIFTTNFRPVKGIKGYFRINMKHGVSEVLTGERHTLGIIFHDALN